MEELQNKSLNPETTDISETPKPWTYDELDAEVRLAIDCALDKKAEDLRILDLRKVASFTDLFVIASGNNQRQVQAISDEVEEQLKKQLSARPIRIEGYRTAEWVLLDYGDFIFHIFNQESREFYDLERLWRDAAKIELPAGIGS